MKLYRKSDAVLVLAHYLLLLSLGHATAAGFLVGGVFKLFAYAGFALLLFFVVGRSANFLKTVAICFYALPSVFFSSSVSPQWVRHSPATLILPDEPLRACLFQRPPPLYSL
jgi:hypothetical protein